MQDHLDFGPASVLSLFEGVYGLLIVCTYYVNLQGQTGGPSPGNDVAVEQYLANRTGFLTNFGVDFIGWEKLPAASRANFANATLANLANYPADWPEVSYTALKTILSMLTFLPGRI
jgi:choline dehydrogenase